MRPSLRLSLTALLLPFIATSLPAQSPVRPSLTPAQVKAVTDSIGKLLTRYYVYPEKGEALNNHLRGKLKNNDYSKITDPGVLAQTINAGLHGVTPDIHMSVWYDPNFEHAQAEREKNKESTHALELAYLKENNFLFRKLEILPGNIGYISFTGFNGMIAESKPTLHAAFTFLKNTQAVILDLRENNGGSPEMVKQIESYFFSKKKHMMDITDRVDGKTSSMWADPELANNLTLSMPVYILTSRRTASAAEDFTYGMQSVQRAVVVGETTAGGAHLTKPFSAGYGFVITIPFARSVNPYTQTNWEGTGIKPDVDVPASQALMKARESFFNKQLSAATSEQEKRKIQWTLHQLTAYHNDRQPEVNDLRAFAGVYQGGLDFYIREGRMVCKNAERGNALFPMQWVSGPLFVLDENVIVEFVKDNQGKYTSINMLWKEGWVTTKSRK